MRTTPCILDDGEDGIGSRAAASLYILIKMSSYLHFDKNVVFFTF